MNMYVTMDVGHSATLHRMVMIPPKFDHSIIGLTNLAINQVKAGGCGVIEIVLDVMKTNIKNPGICYNGLGALGNITSNGNVLQ